MQNLPYKVLLNQLISVSPIDKFLGPVDKWKAHLNTYISSEEALPHRAFSIYLFNSQNKLFFQRRSSQKKTFQLCWTNSCCSHPNIIQYEGSENKLEEKTRDALHRALHREFRMDLTAEKFYLVDKIFYKALGAEGTQYGEFEVDSVYLCKLDKETVKHEIVAEEVCEVEWVAKQALNDFIQNKQKDGCIFSPWFLKMHGNGLLNQWWDMVIKNDLSNAGTEDELKVRSL